MSKSTDARPRTSDDLHVRGFGEADLQVWDELVRRSTSRHFLFLRGYMDYHADRFRDASLMVYDGDRLVALFPATRDGDRVVSHGGLTFGGLISGPDLTTRRTVGALGAVLRTLAGSGASALVYKAVPHIYHEVPSEEDLYALFVHRARLTRRDVALALHPEARPQYSKGRRSSVRSAQEAGFTIERSDEFAQFMRLEVEALRRRHGTNPVHTPEEMELLAGRFPDNIKLYSARREGELLGGVVIYETPVVAHAQYIGATGEGYRIHAMDGIVDHLLTRVYAAKRWFDFGISTENEGRVLNEGLCRNKESFGGRAVSYDTYEIDL